MKICFKTHAFPQMNSGVQFCTRIGYDGSDPRSSFYLQSKYNVSYDNVELNIKYRIYYVCQGFMNPDKGIYYFTCHVNGEHHSKV